MSEAKRTSVSYSGRRTWCAIGAGDSRLTPPQPQWCLANGAYACSLDSGDEVGANARTCAPTRSHAITRRSRTSNLFTPPRGCRTRSKWWPQTPSTSRTPTGRCDATQLIVTHKGVEYCAPHAVNERIRICHVIKIMSLGLACDDHFVKLNTKT